MPCPAWRGYGTPTTASSAPLRRMYSVAFAMSASDRQLFSERCQALVRIAHALPRLAWIRHAHYGELGAVTPDVFGCLCDERFRSEIVFRALPGAGPDSSCPAPPGVDTARPLRRARRRYAGCIRLPLR